MRFVLAACGAALVLGGTAGAGTVQTLTLATRAPAVVSGAGFPPNAKIRISVTTVGHRLTRVVRASRAGKLRASWLQSVPACALVVVVAESPTVHLATRALPASGAACGGPAGPLGPPTLGP